MNIKTFTSTFSIDSGDHTLYDKGVEFVDKLLLNCETLQKVYGTGARECVEIGLAKYRLVGEVIYKGAFLLIIDCHVRIGLVVNNCFRFGNHVYMGNNELDHSSIEVGDQIVVSGRFIFSPLHFCVFTFEKSEHALPLVDFKWRTSRIYRLDEQIQATQPELAYDDMRQEHFSELEQLTYGEPNPFDTVLVESELVSYEPVQIDQKYVGISGYFQSINWVEPQRWIKNCGGRILSGVKVGEWYYFDKEGKEKIEIDYGAK